MDVWDHDFIYKKKSSKSKRKLKRKPCISIKKNFLNWIKKQRWKPRDLIDKKSKPNEKIKKKTNYLQFYWYLLLCKYLLLYKK